MTDHSFFNAFFGDDEPKHECYKCGTDEGLVVAYTKENGDQVWICRDCREKREQEQRERAERNRASAEASLARDRREESF